MRRSTVLAFATLAWLALSFSPTVANPDNSVQNMKGDVSYQKGAAAPQPIALNATASLNDNDYMLTGDQSIGQVTLPDSSTVEVGQASKIQMVSFTQKTIATAKFVIVNGTLRFAVRHPHGAKANYTFSTPTGQIAIRGTEGDIGYDSNGNLQVNVYEQCEVTAPVQIFASNGVTYSVSAGHSFTGRFVNHVLQVAVNQLTQAAVDRFNQFGVPTNWDQATGQVTSYVDNKTTSGVNSVTGGFGGQFVPSIGGLFKKKATPTPAPTTAPSTCT
jgi:hypothetical protein